MDFLVSFFSNPQMQGLSDTLMNFAVTLAVTLIAALYTRITSRALEEKHRSALHQALKSGVESAVLHGPGVALGTIKAHAIQHARESVPEALKALTPGDGVLDTIVERYAREFLNSIGEPK